MDFVTLLTCCAVAEGCLAAAILVSERGVQNAGWRIWAGASALRFVSFLLYLSPVFLQGQRWNSGAQLLAVLLILQSSLLSMQGTARFLDLPAPSAAQLWPLLLMAIGYLLAFLVFDDPRWRIAFVSLGLAYGLGWSAWRIWGGTIGLTLERGFVIGSLGLWVGLLLARTGHVLSLQADATASAISVATRHPWFFLGYLVACIGTVVGILGLRNSELIKKVEQAEQDAVQRANTDALTGLLSRPAILGQAEGLFAERGPAAGNSRLAVMMLDCDHFKSINDRFGHLFGDLVLKRLAQAMRDALPPGAFAGRYGGEEFLVLLPQASDSQARAVAASLCQAVQDIALESGRRAVALTISVGVTVWEADDKAMVDLIGRADAALMLAKDNGRNRVVFATAGGVEELPGRPPLVLEKNLLTG